ncbi:thioredoxin domain-containing protein (plasmid) [Agrobacterium tumefaciens]|nr:thioredoxin domain-containing protein [Agrobacterium tumefaciens]
MVLGFCSAMLIGPCVTAPLAGALSDVRLVLKDWPIFGGASILAAQAVLEAAQIGKYEIAMEALMKTKGRLSEEDVEKALSGAGLTMPEIAAAINSNNSKISGLLDRNYGQALSFNFVGTPSFVIGKTIYPGVLDEKGLKDAIKRART